MEDMSPAERNYSEMEKEALACDLAVKKFHSYSSGNSLQ